MQGGLAVQSQSRTAGWVIVDFRTELQYGAGFRGKVCGVYLAPRPPCTVGPPCNKLNFGYCFVDTTDIIIVKFLVMLHLYCQILTWHRN